MTIYQVHYHDQTAQIEAATPEIAALAFIVYCAPAAQDDYFEAIHINQLPPLLKYLTLSPHYPMTAENEFFVYLKAARTEAKVLEGSRQDRILSHIP